MGRAKAGMELISNKKSRRRTYEKRRKGLEKKAHELSTLCGVKVGLIIYGQKDTNRPMEPNIWPENHQAIHTLINSYKEENVEDRRRRTSDMSMFYRDRTKKAEEELTKLYKKNIEAKHPTWDEHYDTLTFEELRQFGGLLATKLQAMKARLDFMKGTQTYFADSAAGGSSCMINSIAQNAQLQSQDQNSYIIQSLFRRSSMQLEIIQPQPVATFNPLRYGVDAPFCKNFNSFDANSMANPTTLMLMNDIGGSTGNAAYSTHKSPARYNHPVVPAVPLGGEHVDGNHVEAPLQYYIPAMQPMPVFLQYPLQSRGSTQMHSTQMEEFYEMEDFQFMDQK